MEMKLIFTLVFITGLVTSFQKSATNLTQYNKGLVFEDTGDFLLTGNHWILLTNIDLKEYFQILSQLESQVNLAKQYAQRFENSEEPVFASIIEQEVTFLETEVDITRETLINIERSIFPSKRKRRITKRGLIDIVGKGMKFLFGTADSDDLEKIDKALKTENVKNDQIFHLIKEQASLINDSLTIGKRNAKVIQKVKDALILVGSRLETLVARVETNSETEDLIISIIRLLSSFQVLESSLSYFRDDLNFIVTALDIVSQNRISSYLVPPAQLYETLVQIQPKLPETLTFTIPLTLEHIYLYYSIITVDTAVLEGKLKLFIKVPLKSPQNHFKLYKVIPLPIMQKDLSMSIIIEPESEFLAISADQQKYMHLNSQDLLKCTNSIIKLCEPVKAIFRGSKPSCLHGLFVGDNRKVKELCEKRVNLHPTDTFIKLSNENTWLYSITKPKTLAIKCLQHFKTGPILKQVVLKQTTGKIQLLNGCSAHGENVMIPAHYKEVTKFSQHTSKILVPKISEILNAEESKILSKVNDKTLKEVKTILKGIDSNDNLFKDSSIKMGTLLKQIKEYEKEYATPKFDLLPSHTYQTLTILIIVALMLLLIIYVCMKRQKIKNKVVEIKRKCIKPSPTQDISIQETVELGHVEPTNESSLPTVAPRRAYIF